MTTRLISIRRHARISTRQPQRIIAFNADSCREIVKRFLTTWTRENVDRLTTPDFKVTHKVKGLSSVLACVDKSMLLDRVDHIRQAFPDFAWNPDLDSMQVDVDRRKVRVTLRKSGCHTQSPFAPPGTGLDPLEATSQCFLTDPFDAIIKFDDQKGDCIARFDIDQFIDEVGPHGIYKMLSQREVSPLETYQDFLFPTPTPPLNGDE